MKDKKNVNLPFGARMAQGAVQKAIDQGNAQSQKHVSVLVDKFDEMIDKVNWVMITQQKICDKLGIVLDDPLEK